MEPTVEACKAPTIEELNKEAANTIYTPLEPGTIRLVHLHPASDSKADVVCSLEYARLSDKPRYQALSYVWGSQNEPKEIRLNETTILITQNLDKALRRLRLQHEPRVIWVDALALNQSDIDERNAEVQVMRNIYSSAYETLAWFDKGLGDDEDYILSRLAEPRYNLLEASRNIWSNMTYDAIKNALFAIARQCYWKRVWTAQEIRYSKQVTLVTTRCEVPFVTLPRLSDVVSELVGVYTDLKTTFDVALRYFQRKCLTVRPLGPSADGHLDLSSWIDICCLRTCSNQRDLVFGLWPWLLPQVQSRVKVDYSLPIEQVLRSCKKAFLDTTGTLDFLGLSNLFNYTEDAVLPSWDPELYFRGPNKGRWELRCLPELLCLDHDRRWSQTDLASVSGYMRTLHVKGNRIGMITMAAAKMTDFSLFDCTVATMKSLQIKVDEAEELSFAVRPLYAYYGIYKNLNEDLIQVARYLSNSERATMSRDDCLEILIQVARYLLNLERATMSRGDFLEIWARYDHRYTGRIQRYFSVTRLEVDASIATDWGKTRALFGLMWYTTAEPGDQVYLVHGCSRPLLFRPADGDPGKHKLIGAIFFPGPEGKENPLIDELLTRPDSPVSDIFIC